MNSWVEEIEYMALELRQVEEQCKKDGKSCENCGCIRFSGNKCIDLTCWRGFDENFGYFHVPPSRGPVQGAPNLLRTICKIYRMACF